jgi:hypothetical protein
VAFSEPEQLRHKHLTHDRARLRARVAQYQRLANEYRVMQADAELELGAIETELRRLRSIK